MYCKISKNNPANRLVDILANVETVIRHCHNQLRGSLFDVDFMAAMLKIKLQNFCKSLYIFGSTRRNMIFNCALFSAARFCRAPMKSDTRSQRLTSEKSKGFSEAIRDKKKLRLV